ncbi:hypothetical protein BDY24DRAFT_412918 [Mrakia frigida]|uniref:uncharacterized protein n=1 Tax=Mrakia frigida TaxID=29902 RepID=UPI003FCC017A
MSSVLDTLRSTLFSSSKSLPLMEALPPFPSFPLYSLSTFPAALSALAQTPSLEALKQFYLTAQPIHSALLLCSWNVLWTWLAGEITGNVSQVDRVWTFVPLVYTIHFTIQPLVALYSLLPQAQRPETLAAFWNFFLNNVDHRQALALGTQIVWSARLTYNAARRGFFDPRSEDYRWPVARDMVPAWAFKIFNFAFIALYQNILLMLIAIPSHYLLIQAHPQTYHSPPLPEKVSHALMTYPYLTTSDYVLASLALLCVYGEYVSDGIQQSYQSWKHTPDSKRPKTKRWTLFPFGLGPSITWGEEDRKRGFVAQGTWAYSRHPAFALEQTFWWLQSFFPILPLFRGFPTAVVKAFHATGDDLFKTVELLVKDVVLVESFPFWAIAGPLALSGLFMGSTLFTEWISTPKYPLYSAVYKKRVAMFWPIETYFKRVWLSLTQGNEKRKLGERKLGWGERRKVD